MNEVLVTISLSELCEQEALNEAMVIEIVEHGIADPIDGSSSADWVFDTTTCYWLQKAVRLRNDFDIEWIAVAMLIDLLQQKQALEKQNEHYQRQLQRFLDSP